MGLDNFITKFSGLTESYKFYNGEVELRYDPESHVYLLFKDGQLIEQPSVTTICHIIDKSNALMPWACKMMAEKLISTIPQQDGGVALLEPIHIDKFTEIVNQAKSAHKEKVEEAATVGKIAHSWIEQYIKDELAGKPEVGLLPEDERAKNACIAALDWMQKHNVRWKATETKIYSRKFGYAGTMDGLALVDSCGNPKCCQKQFKDHLSVIDWKTSNYLYVEYILQTAAYLWAYAEENPVEYIHDRWVIRLGKDDAEFEPWYFDTVYDDFTTFCHALDLYKAINKLEDRMQVKKDFIKSEKKKQKELDKQAALALECKGYKKYKGKNYPKCNNGKPCKSCLNLYYEKHPEFDVKVLPVDPNLKFRVIPAGEAII